MKYLLFEATLKKFGVYYKKEVLLKDLMPDEAKNQYKHKFKIDYVVFGQDLTVCIEIEGGAFANGRHTRGSGFINDMLKYNSIVAAGYPLLRFTPEMITKHPVKVVSFIVDFNHVIFDWIGKIKMCISNKLV